MAALPVEEEFPRLTEADLSTGGTSSTWEDWLRQAAGAGIGVASGILGGVEAAASSPFEEDPNALAGRERMTALQDWLGEKQKEVLGGISPQGRKNLEASWFPTEGKPDVF